VNGLNVVLYLRTCFIFGVLGRSQ